MGKDNRNRKEMIFWIQALNAHLQDKTALQSPAKGEMSHPGAFEAVGWLPELVLTEEMDVAIRSVLLEKTGFLLSS